MSFRQTTLCSMLLATMVLLAACSGLDDIVPEHFDTTDGGGVLVLCEGNYNSGNATLSYYNPELKQVENGVFQRANDRKLGDTGQSITIHDGVAYIAVENSGIIWAMNTDDFRVRGQMTSSQTEHMINPRYVHILSDNKAYATDLYSPYITVFNPQTMQYVGSIATGQPSVGQYASTEQMAVWKNELFTNCWCYSDKILIIDTDRDEVTDSICLGTSQQPKSIRMDRNGKLWAITDGGYSSQEDQYGEDVPHLYRIDAASRHIELDISLPTDEASVQLALNHRGDTLYLINNDVYRLPVSADEVPTTPFIKAPRDANGTLHKLYGLEVSPNGELYVADAVDYRQSGTVYRYAPDGQLRDIFRVGINPNGFAFTHGNSTLTEKEHEQVELLSLTAVDTVFEYMPAPGHQVNGYSVTGDFIHPGATMQEACDSVLNHFRKGYMVSLGGQGGYVVAGFRQPVLNTNGDYELCIKGNPYSYQSEPGIIWVMEDTNGDGQPNDTWYELAGSEYGTTNETLSYAITYYKPTQAGQDIQWTDNQGGTGIIPYMPAWNQHDSYWQDWVPTLTDEQGREYHTYYGSRLKDTHTYDEKTGMSQMPPFGWGYADNGGSDYFRNPEVDAPSSLGYYKISNAVTATGQPANLHSIHFVKVQTAQTGWTPNLGEISTEVHGIWRIVR